MALGTMKGVKEVDGHKVMTNEDRPLDKDGNVDWEAFDKMREEFPICIDHEKDMISFKMMTSPVSEGGSGCQLTTLTNTSLIMLSYLNAKFPCRENSISVTKLEEFLMWQKKRTENRKARGVEGFNKD